jgi:hypothetical protein
VGVTCSFFISNSIKIDISGIIVIFIGAVFLFFQGFGKYMILYDYESVKYGSKFSLYMRWESGLTNKGEWEKIWPTRYKGILDSSFTSCFSYVATT